MSRRWGARAIELSLLQIALIVFGLGQAAGDGSALPISAGSGGLPIELALAVSDSDQALSQRRQATAVLADGGFAVVWHEGGPLLGCESYSRYCEVRMQWVSPDGTLRFESGGRPVGSTADNELDPLVVASPLGGSFVAFQRGNQRRVLVQRFDANGDAQWADEGVLAVDPPAEIHSQLDAHLIADPAGGVLVCFRTLNPSGIRCQLLDGSGARLWPDEGVPAASGSQLRVLPRGVSDESGGFLVFWRNQRDQNDAFVEPMLMEGQHFASDGSKQWGEKPLVIRTTNLAESNGNSMKFFGVVSDGAGGAIVAFTDWTGESEDGLDVIAQRVAGDGRFLWADGAVVVGEDGHQQHDATVGDALGGAFVVAYHEVSSTASDLRVYHLGLDGAALWTADGLPLSDPAAVALDYGAHGSFDRGILRLTWTHQLQPALFEMDVHLARFTIAGTRLDGVAGLPLTTETDAQFLNGFSYSPTTHQLLAGWDDRRKGTWEDLDVYGALLEDHLADGFVVTPPTHAFGSVPPGGQRALEVTLSNDLGENVVVADIRPVGSADLFLNPAGGASPCGSFTPLLIPGQSCTVELAYRPPVAGALDGLLAVESDSPLNPLNTVLLSGNSCFPFLDLEQQTVTTEETYTACVEIRALQGFEIEPPGLVVFRAGQGIVLGEGFRVAAGALFRAEIDPVLLPVSAR